jgi:hypothetical protein
MPPKKQKKQLKFTTSPTEKTTAITDFLLSVVTAGAILSLQQIKSHDIWKINIWSAAFGFITLSGLLGTIAHGIALSEKIHRRIWRLLNLCLGAAVSVFVIGIFHIVQIIGIMVLLAGLRSSLI